MAHFAEVDDNNIVTRVLVVPNEQEHRGQDFLANDLGLGGNWIQTSYNARIRKNYAGIGFIYHTDIDAFSPAKCHDEAVLNADTALWDCTNASHVVIPMEENNG